MGLFSNGGARSGASDLVLSAPRHSGARDRRRKFKAGLLFGYFLVAAISARAHGGAGAVRVWRQCEWRRAAIGCARSGQ